jgi:hypothetical protein
MAPRKQAGGRFVCVQSFGYFTEDGAIDHVHVGEIVPAGHPVMKGRDWAFQPLDQWGSGRFDPPAVEQATAAPGEKRGG